MSRIAVLCLLTLALAGCSEGRTDEDSGPMEVDSGPMDVDAGPMDVDAGPGDDAGATDAGGGAVGLTGLIINEIDANDEWTELYNSTSAPIALGGVRVTDSDAGAPRVDRAFAFPAGFNLEPGGYILVIKAAAPEIGVISTTCDVGTRCLHTDWGISDGSGETVYLLAPAGDDTVLLEQEYPPTAVPNMQSYGRVPNATGDFTACTPTPEATNEPAP